MLGLMGMSFADFVAEHFGADKWEAIQEASEVDSMELEDGEDLSRTVLAAIAILGIDEHTLGTSFGCYFANCAVTDCGYAQLLGCSGRSLVETVERFNDFHLYFSGGAIAAPDVWVDQMSPNSFRLHVRSRSRCMAAWLQGVVETVSLLYFRTPTHVCTVDEGTDGGGHQVLLVTDGVEDGVAGAGGFSECVEAREALSCVAKNSVYQMDHSTFYSLFPFHMVIDSECRVIQVGSVLQNLLPDLAKAGASVGDFFQIRHPSMLSWSFDNLLHHTQATCSVVLVNANGLELKGSFIHSRIPSSVGGGGEQEVALFMGSPNLGGFFDMKRHGICLSDIPSFDMAGDLMLAREQHQSEAAQRSVDISFLESELELAEQGIQRLKHDLLHVSGVNYGSVEGEGSGRQALGADPVGVVERLLRAPHGSTISQVASEAELLEARELLLTMTAVKKAASLSLDSFSTYTGGDAEVNQSLMDMLSTPSHVVSRSAFSNLASIQENPKSTGGGVSEVWHRLAAAGVRSSTSYRKVVEKLLPTSQASSKGGGSLGGSLGNCLSDKGMSMVDHEPVTHYPISSRKAFNTDGVGARASHLNSSTSSHANVTASIPGDPSLGSCSHNTERMQSMDGTSANVCGLFTATASMEVIMLDSSARYQGTYNTQRSGLPAMSANGTQLFAENSNSSLREESSKDSLRVFRSSQTDVLSSSRLPAPIQSLPSVPCCVVTPDQWTRHRDPIPQADDLGSLRVGKRRERRTSVLEKMKAAVKSVFKTAPSNLNGSTTPTITTDRQAANLMPAVKPMMLPLGGPGPSLVTNRQADNPLPAVSPMSTLMGGAGGHSLNRTFAIKSMPLHLMTDIGPDTSAHNLASSTGVMAVVTAAGTDDRAVGAQRERRARCFSAPTQDSIVQLLMCSMPTGADRYGAMYNAADNSRTTPSECAYLGQESSGRSLIRMKDPMLPAPLMPRRPRSSTARRASCSLDSMAAHNHKQAMQLRRDFNKNSTSGNSSATRCSPLYPQASSITVLGASSLAAYGEGLSISHSIAHSQSDASRRSLCSLLALLKEPADELACVLEQTDDWQFDAFRLDAASNGRPLSSLAFSLFQRTGVISTLNLDASKLARFLVQIEEGYGGNPYHSRTHAADVLRTIHVLATRGGLKSSICPSYKDVLPSLVDHLDVAHAGLSPRLMHSAQSTAAPAPASGQPGDVDTSSSVRDAFLLLTIYFAAIVHDFDHRGVNNHFLIRMSDPLALLYNDASPMENHHVAAAFILLKGDAFNFMADLPKSAKCCLRAQVIDMVLSTDMKQHFGVASQFAGKLATLQAAVHATSLQQQQQLAAVKKSVQIDDSSSGSSPSLVSGHRPPQKRSSLHLQTPFNGRRSVSLHMPIVNGVEGTGTGSGARFFNSPINHSFKVVGAGSISRRPTITHVGPLKPKLGEPHSAGSPPIDINLTSSPKGALELPFSHDPSMSTGGFLSHAHSRSSVGSGCITRKHSDLVVPFRTSPPSVELASCSSSFLTGSETVSIPRISPSGSDSQRLSEVVAASDDDTKMMFWKVALKCADLGHLTSKAEVHKKWVLLLEEEMFRQGDLESAAGLSASALMDRRKTGITKQQPGFFHAVVLPLYTNFAQLFPTATPLLQGATDNLSMWIDADSAPLGHVESPRN